MLSAYERQRLETIAQNEQKLNELGLGAGTAALLPRTANVTTAKSARTKRVKEPQEPSRRSARIKLEEAPRVYVAEEEEGATVKIGGADAATVQEEVARIDLDDLPIDTTMLLEEESRVYEILRSARNAKAKAMERSMFIVCNDRTLCEMVRTLPVSNDELMQLFGMGTKKVAAHGDLLLSTLAPHIGELQAAHQAYSAQQPCIVD
jgi:superfamily II DNA helicase RecQ